MEHIKDCIAGLREAAPEIDIAENELMRRHTTFAIGGPADLFVQPKTRRELTAALAVLRERNIPFLLPGNGSNMLVADAGIRGAVVCTSELDEVRVNEDNTVSAEAGARYCLQSNAATATLPPAAVLVSGDAVAFI